MARSFIFAIVSVICFCSSASAQLFGVRAGINVGTQSGYLPSTSKTGVLAGVATQIDLANKLSIQISFLYDQKGAVLQDEAYEQDSYIPSPVTRTVTSNYLEIPFAFEYFIGAHAFEPYLFAGPTVGVLLSGSQTSSADPTHSTDYTPKLIDPGVLFGIGVSYRAEAFYAFADAGMALSVMNIDATARSKDFRISAGALFPL